MEPIFYMEYKESRKIIEEMFDAYFKYRNHKVFRLFQVSDIKKHVDEKTAKRWAEIKQASRKERTISVEFYEENFCCVTGDIRQEYSYEEIQAICETNTTLALVADKKRKKDAFLGLKKGSVRGRSLADLKTFLLAHCPKAGNEIIHL